MSFTPNSTRRSGRWHPQVMVRSWFKFVKQQQLDETTPGDHPLCYELDLDMLSIRGKLGLLYIVALWFLIWVQVMISLTIYGLRQSVYYTIYILWVPALTGLYNAQIYQSWLEGKVIHFMQMIHFIHGLIIQDIAILHANMLWKNYNDFKCKHVIKTTQKFFV